MLSDALTAADARQVTLIALLDLTTAFDCVDHALLVRRLQYNFGFTDDVLRWITSFVTGRTQQVSYDGQLSPIQCSSEYRRGPFSARCCSCCTPPM